jgi:bifunctional non-homologous end joining protein LigD
LAIFSTLRQRRNEAAAFLYAFDLLELNGTDMRREPIEVRKATLASILRKSRPGVRLNEHLEHPDGALVFAHACKMGVEGIVSKRLGSRYRSGRSPDWLKFKNPEAPALSARPKRIGDDDYPQMQDAHSATALMCGETEWSK